MSLSNEITIGGHYIPTVEVKKAAKELLDVLNMNGYLTEENIKRIFGEEMTEKIDSA